MMLAMVMEVAHRRLFVARRGHGDLMLGGQGLVQGGQARRVHPVVVGEQDSHNHGNVPRGPRPVNAARPGAD